MTPLRLGSLLCVAAWATGAAALPLNAAPRALENSPWAGLVEVRLPAQHDLGMLRRYVEPWIERQGEWRSFYTGRFGPASWISPPRLAWTLNGWDPALHDAARPALAPAAVPSGAGAGTPPPTTVAPALELRAPGGPTAPELSPSLDLLPSWQLTQPPPVDATFLTETRTPRCKPWQRPYTVTLARHGGEQDTFTLLECDGSVAVDALDRLSVVARPPGVERPALPLPLEPLDESEPLGEWVPNVRLLDPRLLWVVARISEAFPGRPIYVISGYRRDGHGSFHRKGRALDLFVMDVPNEALMRVCRALKDVGCGFYPHNKFVHVDVRPPGTGHAVWVDVSEPGQPSRYVDGWPGVVERGALSWGHGE